MSHTPTPWRIAEPDEAMWEGQEFRLTDADGVTIATFQDLDMVDARRDAAFILRAVNAYEASQELLQRVADLTDSSYCEWCCEHAPKDGKTGEITGPVSHVSDCLVRTAAALVEVVD